MGTIDPERIPTVHHAYLHIPYCLQKCAYCAFFSQPESSVPEWYIDTLIREISIFQNRYNPRFQTVYFGGGTPSLCNTSQLHRILYALSIAPGAEITIEVNPGAIRFDPAQLSGHINRVSIGVQSSNDCDLHFLGRLHSYRQSVECMERFRSAGFQNISCDLMYGLPDQTAESAMSCLEDILRLTPEHVSTYCLSIEPGTLLHNSGTLTAGEDETADMYDSISQLLESRQYSCYEISNFAQAGKESRHNMACWTYQPYVGFGAGAAGFSGSFRYRNPASVSEWKEHIDNGQLFHQMEVLSKSERMKEFVILGLRLSQGISISEFRQMFGLGVMNVFGSVIPRFLELDLLHLTGDVLHLAPEARFISNEIFSELYQTHVT